MDKDSWHWDILNKARYKLLIGGFLLATIVSAYYLGYMGKRGQEQASFEDELGASVISGADFLVRMQNTDGSFKYIYYPESNEYSTANNILRHTGVVYSLLMVYEYSGEEKYLWAAEHGIDFLMRHVEYMDEEKAYVFFNDKAKLGGAALAAIALAKHEELEATGEYRDTVRHLVDFILYMQQDSGKFTSFYIYNGEYKSPSDSQIYPGEALLALIRAYGLLEEEEYLTSMEKAFEHYSQAFKDDPSTAFTSWTTTALAELHLIRPERKYVDFVFLMQDWLTSGQYTHGADDPRYLGGYGPGVPTVSAGSKTEGVADAYLLAERVNDRERAERYKESMMMAVNFLTQLQYTEELASIHPDPEVAVGAFFHHFGEYSARVDYTQHCISAMIKALTYHDQPVN
ncbi:hypothetical protein GF319_15900 [Candidatus Bathyarchaeota archaeon]|nr:hypothetical protein [Candidatus Bathyarchaeota archaeon]